MSKTAARAVLSSLARQGYVRMSKNLAEWAMKSFAFILEVVNVGELAGFNVIPMRWKVEPVRHFCVDALVPAVEQRLRIRLFFSRVIRLFIQYQPDAQAFLNRI